MDSSHFKENVEKPRFSELFREKVQHEKKLFIVNNGVNFLTVASVKHF